MHTSTRTIALLEISRAAYEEIKAAILKARQPERLKSFIKAGRPVPCEAVDLHGIAVIPPNEEGQGAPQT
jgi:hypothetical protein